MADPFKRAQLKALRAHIRELAGEARINRTGERQAKSGSDESTLRLFHYQRTVTVRREARAAQLASAFLRGKEYAAIEPHCRYTPRWADVVVTLRRFGWYASITELRRWAEAKVAAAV